ncbi:MAG TPA: hypothetical protein VFH47_01125, partial [Candidatus Thermoplasmatota archaeon]|nr:hypothetical protein [Candidatus Thermoplasmatota archaeon]
MDRPGELDDLSARDADELARELAERHRELAVAAAVGRAGVARAEAYAASRDHGTGASVVPPALR